MKLKLTLAAMTLSASTAFGTTLQVNTRALDATVSLTDSTGASLLGGFAAFGTWSGVAITNQASFASEFTIGQYDNGIDAGLTPTTTDIVNFTGFGATPREGFATEQFTKSSLTSDANKNIVVAFWKGGSTQSSATELVVFQLGVLYETGSDPLNVDYLTATEGTEGINGTGLLFGTSRTQTAALSAVPEPSSTALLGLGSVALLLRRRR